jgi:Yip1-like protein
MSALQDAIALVRNPVAFMQQNKDSTLSVNSIMINYVAILALIPFVAILIGDLWYYAHFGLYGYAVVIAIVTYIFDVGAVFAVGIAIWKLAPRFDTTTDQARATLLAAYIFTPAFLVSILTIFPYISWIGLLGLLYGLYILYLGVPVLMTTPADKVMDYVVVIIIATFVVFAIVELIAGTVTARLF